MPVENQNRERVRTLLHRASVGVNEALGRVDSMGDYELAEAAGLAASTRAFFDFNVSCAGESNPSGAVTLPGGERAFFDFNGSCGGASSPNVDAVRGAALVRALSDAVR